MKAVIHSPTFGNCLFSDAEARKNHPQQIVAGELARDRYQLVVRQPQFLGKQIQHAVAQGRMFRGDAQVFGRPLQRLQVPFSRQEGGFGGRVPARNGQQFGA